MSTTTAPEAPPVVDEAPPARRRITARRVFYVLGALWVLVAPFYVNASGSLELSPGFAAPTAPLVDLGVEGELNGELHLLAVHVSVPTLAEWLRAKVDDTRDLRPRDAVIPEGTTNRDYFARQRENFASVFEVAAAVGLEAAGFEVRAVSSVGVEGVVEGGPSDGRLRPGDRIVAVDGRRVSGIEDLVARLRDGDDEAEPIAAGDEVALGVLRVVEDPADDAEDADPTTDVVEEAVDVVVVAERLDLDGDGRRDRAGIGITGSTFVTGVELPFTAELDNSRGIGGPSAGLAFALTVYDLASDEDLLRGREVHVTGTIDRAGRVGNIGGIRQKVVSAARSDADVVLVPERQLADALAAAPTDLRVIGVATFDEALQMLRAA